MSAGRRSVKISSWYKLLLQIEKFFSLWGDNKKLTNKDHFFPWFLGDCGKDAMTSLSLHCFLWHAL